MQRHNSLTSLHSLSSSRSNTTDYVRDSSTGALLDNSKFAKKSRKPIASSPKPAFNFPNGETFTPRTAPSKRSKPARIASHPNRQLKKSSSLVSVHSATSNTGYPQPLPQLKHSHSFSNLKEKSRQSLMDSIRTNRLDTPTNIVLQAANNPTPSSTRHTYSLTNNRYCENSSNIVRNESLVDTTQLRLSCSDSNPSSISNYNRSGSNTPQTSVSGSEVASDISRSEGSTGSVSSFTNGKETCSLESIQEISVSDSLTPPEMHESLVIFTASTSYPNDSRKESAPITESEAHSKKTARESSNKTRVSSSRSTLKTNARSSAKGGNPNSGSSSSSASSYRSFSEADDIDNASPKRGASDGESLDLPDRQAQDEHDNSGSKEARDNKHNNDDESVGSSDDLNDHDYTISDANETESEYSESESDSEKSRASPPVIEKPSHTAESTGRTLRSTSAVVAHRLSTADLPEPSLPEPEIIFEAPAKNTYLKVGSRVSSERHEPPQLDFENESRSRRMSPSISPPHTPTVARSGTTTPLIQSSVPPTPVSKTTAPPTPISKDSVSSTSIEVISDRESNEHSFSEEGSTSRSNQYSESAASKFSKTNNSDAPKSSASYRSGDSQKNIREIQNAKVPYKSMLLSEPVPPPKDVKSSPQLKNIIPPKLQESPFSEGSPEAPSPISKDSAYNQRIDHVNTTPLEEVDARQAEIKASESKYPAAGHNVVESGDSDNFDMNAYYSPVQIDKFFKDEQEEVPPRGDLDVNNGFIKVHKRNNSSIGSHSSMQKKSSPLVQQEPVMPPKKSSMLVGHSAPKKSTMLLDHSPPKKPFTPTAARYSMLAVVDVDYDKSLPGTPLRDKRASQLHREFQNALNFDVETASQNSQDEVVNSTSANSPEKKSMLKKFSKFLSAGTKENIPRRLISKTQNSSTSVLSTKYEEGNSVDSKDTQATDRSKSSKTSTLRKKGLFLNLKLSSTRRVDEIPSPVYSVREKQSSVPSKETTPISAKFDLPNYEVENDVFNDVLMRFDEVEKEVEKDIIKLKRGNSIHDFFAKDDELTKDQIVDQKRKDNHQSDESLLSKLSSANSSYESVSVAESKPLPHDSYAGITDDIIAQMKSEEMKSEFPPNESEKTVSISKEQLESACNEPKGTKKSYVNLAKQFADYEEVEIKLKGFDPFRKLSRETDEARSNSMTSEQQSILKRESAASKSATRSVRFSNSISISETYAPYMYKRNNKAVTQYYVSDLNEISRIKNELNAFKCYEMLVHEKSQTNTQFFY